MKVLTKFKRTDPYRHPAIQKGAGVVYDLRDEDVGFSCVVCGDWHEGPSLQGGRINIGHTFTVGDYIYVIPKSDMHKGCRELFQLNPLAYEHTI